MPYTAEKHSRRPDSETLRHRIPGWGVDLNPSDRPSVPRENFDPAATGARWTFPVRQVERRPRERSIEHETLPPVFGTAVPLAGLSGAIRRYAYRYSEGRVVHWLILMAGDRVDAITSHLRSFASLHPDNPITETGALGEIRHHPISSRFGRKRADLAHTWLDPVIVFGPWILTIAVVTAVARAARR